MLRADGSDAHRLDTGPVREFRWSPIGHRIAFAIHDGAVVVNVDGSNRQDVPSADAPVWSPDGTALAYARIDRLTPGSAGQPQQPEASLRIVRADAVVRASCWMGARPLMTVSSRLTGRPTAGTSSTGPTRTSRVPFWRMARRSWRCQLPADNPCSWWTGCSCTARRTSGRQTARGWRLWTGRVAWRGRTRRSQSPRLAAACSACRTRTARTSSRPGHPMAGESPSAAAPLPRVSAAAMMLAMRSPSAASG